MSHDARYHDASYRIVNVKRHRSVARRTKITAIVPRSSALLLLLLLLLLFLSLLLLFLLRRT